VGEADYVREGDRLSITHTGVESRLRGQGLAGELIEVVLHDAKEEGLEVLPYCSYVADYIDKHPQYRDLVPAEQRRRFGIADS
jgi:predicted GNAT family acetyltransferase